MKTISDHVLDIVQNSLRAKATLIEVMVDDDKKNDLYALKIKDNGCGMSKDVLQQAANPFFTSRTTRRVGLGLSLLKQNAEMANGKFKLESEQGKGTELTVLFQHSHIDCPPLGALWEVWYLILLANQGVRMVLDYQTGKGLFRFDSHDLAGQSGEVFLMHKEMKDAIIEFIKSNLMELEARK